MVRRREVEIGTERVVGQGVRRGEGLQTNEVRHQGGDHQNHLMGGGTGLIRIARETGIGGGMAIVRGIRTETGRRREETDEKMILIVAVMTLPPHAETVIETEIMIDGGNVLQTVMVNRVGVEGNRDRRDY